MFIFNFPIFYFARNINQKRQRIRVLKPTDRYIPTERNRGGRRGRDRMVVGFM